MTREAKVNNPSAAVRIASILGWPVEMQHNNLIMVDLRTPAAARAAYAELVGDSPHTEVTLRATRPPTAPPRADQIMLNKLGYDPIDDDSDTGYRRPPHDAASVCDYFGALGYVEDGGRFVVEEMEILLNDPAAFFGARARTVPESSR